MNNEKIKNKRGFTLMELLVALAILAVVSAIFVLTINPVAHFARQRNFERESHLIAILDAIDKHRTQHGGSFSCTTSFADLSGNGNVGMCFENECPAKNGGRFGEGLIFDGNNENIRIKSSESLDVQDKDLSVSLWVKPAVDSSEFSSGWNYFLVYEEDLKFELGFVGTGGPKFAVYNSGGTRFEVGADFSFTADEWQHIVAVRNGTFVGLYVNGVLQDSRSDFNGALRSGEVLKIGGNGLGNGFNGVIDELIIYDEALSSSEVSALFSGVMRRDPILIMDFIESADMIPVSTTTIASNSEGGFDISCLVPDTLKTIPLDPKSESAYYNNLEDYNTGYKIIKNENTGRTKIMAPSAELDREIFFER